MSIDEIPKTALSPGFETKNLNSDANPGQSEAIQQAVSANLAQPLSILVQPKELGGRIGADPTRYGDWEKNGRCIDF